MDEYASDVAFNRRDQNNETAKEATKLYDGVDKLWKVLYGNHVHVGYYPNPAEKSERLADAQERAVDQIMAVAGLDSKVRKVLDVGCGVGGTSCHIAKKLGCQAVGVNISGSQVASANQLAASQGFLPSQVHFVEGDALDLPASVGSADVVLSLESACYMPDKRRFIQQLASRVDPGGKLVLVDFCRSPQQLSEEQAGYLRQMDELFATAGGWTSMEEYSSMLKDEGLVVQKVQDWTPHIRGFWEASLVELFGHVPQLSAKSSWMDIGLAILKKVLLTGYLVADGGWPTLKMAYTFLTAAQQRIVQGAFSSGALRYQILVAARPRP